MLTLAERLQLLYDVVYPGDVPATDSTVAAAAGMSADEAAALRSGQTTSPGAVELARIARYFRGMPAVYLIAAGNDPDVVELHNALLMYRSVIADGSPLVALRGRTAGLSSAGQETLHSLVDETRVRYGTAIAC